MSTVKKMEVRCRDMDLNEADGHDITGQTLPPLTMAPHLAVGAAG